MVPGHEVKVERHGVLHKTKVLQILHIPQLEKGPLCNTTSEKKNKKTKKENEKGRKGKMERMK